MLDELLHFMEHFYDYQHIAGKKTADWIVYHLTHIKKRVQLLTRPKSEHPSTYETVDPEIARLHWLETHQSSRD